MQAEGQLVIFELSNQLYALPIEETQEIISTADITKVPNSKNHIEGIINLKGSIVPVINLNRRLGSLDKGNDDSTRIIVVEYDGQKIGMLVQNVQEVCRYSDDEVEPPVMVGGSVEYISGVIKKEDSLWLLLNLAKVI